jgi:hypothetical protein
VNNLYKENYKLLKKEIEEDYRRWRRGDSKMVARGRKQKASLL